MKRMRNRVLWICALFLAAGPARAADRFVATNGNDAAAGTNWATAKLTIQAAVDAAVDGETVWVSNGVYATGARAAGGITNRIAVTNAISLRSVNGPEVTIIDGSNQVRGVYMSTGVILDGFTVTRGGAITGGGVYVSGSALVTNCTLVQNLATNGGGIAYGTVRNCRILQNSCIMYNGGCPLGGGAYGSAIYDSVIISNRVNQDGNGGGIFGGMASNCLIQMNSAYQGGGTAQSLAVGCQIIGNLARVGIGSYGGTNRNCLIAFNAGSNPFYSCIGGGAAAATLLNCTVVSNTLGGSGSHGGGADNCTISNSIIYYNSCTGGTGGFSCVETVFPGLGNITNDPGFVDGFHLPETSPCVDSGTNGDWTVDSLDLDGGPRIRNGRVDMGCYEQSRSSSLSPPSITIPVAVSAGETGCYRTTNSVIVVEGLKIAGTWTALSDARGLFMASGIQQEYSGTIWSNSQPFTEFQSTFTYRSATNDEANPVGTDSTVLVITRAGTDTPGIMITSSPPVLFYSVTNIVLGGTNNPHVVETMWVTNDVTGESLFFPAPVYPDRAWLTPACVLVPGTNSFMVHGSNILGTTSDSTLSVVRGGLGPPAWAISSAPPANVGFAITNCTLAGTNNEHVAEIRVSNSLNGATAFCGTPSGSIWIAPSIPLGVGTNDLYAFGCNVLGQVATSTVTVVRSPARTFYVDAASTNPAAPYQSWNTAAGLIATVLTLALDGDTIMVGPGTYTNSLTISKGIRLASADGPHATTILGNGGRCITITHSNAVVSGFTITGGRNQDGAGVHMSQAGARVENCIVVGNGAETNNPYRETVTLSGGGIFGGTARNCLITSNFLYVTTPARYSFANACGAGTASCMAENCTVVGNTAGVNGYYEYAWGGCHGGSNTNCIIVSNPGTTGWHGSFDSSNMGNPGFADGEYHLADNSFCINAGAYQDWMDSATDLDGAPRMLGGTVDIGCYETSRKSALAPPAVDAPIVISPGSGGLWHSTNDAIWVQGTKPVDCLAVLSVDPSNWYSTNGMFQTAGGTTWSNWIPRNWDPPAEIKTWRFRSASTDGATISSGETLLKGTAAGFGGLPEIQMDPPISTDHWAHATQYALSGSRNPHTCERMWASNQANGATASFDAALYPASNWVASPLPLVMGTNVLQVFGTNMIGDVAMAEYEIFRSFFGATCFASNGTVRFGWVMPTDPAGTYQWQRSVDLLGGIWSNVGASVSATQAMETLIETDTAIPAFFRMIRTGD